MTFPMTRSVSDCDAINEDNICVAEAFLKLYTDDNNLRMTPTHYYSYLLNLNLIISRLVQYISGNNGTTPE